MAAQHPAVAHHLRSPLRAQAIGRWLLALWILLSLPGLAAADSGNAGLERGIAHFRTGEYAPALVELSVAARDPAIDPAVHLYLGYTLYKLARFDEATGRIRRALAADSSLDGPLPRFYLGLSLYRRQLYLGAREELQQVVRLSGGARLASQAEGFLTAIEKVVAGAKPETALAFFEQGLAALTGDRPEASIDLFEEARRWLPRVDGTRRAGLERELHLYLTGALCLGGRCAEALARLPASGEVARSGRLQLARALALAGTGKIEEAREILARLAREGPPRVQAAARRLLRAYSGRR